MIKFQIEPLKIAAENTKKPVHHIAALAESSAVTVKKILEGDTNVLLESVEKLAHQLKFDVVVSFEPQAASACEVETV